MAYTKQTWSDNNPAYPASAARFAHLEDGVFDAFASGDTHAALTTSAHGGIVGKGDHVVDVRDYGAVGDGVTDDTAEIQAAIDAAAGRAVFFPPTGLGFKISAPLVMKRGTHLVGAQRPAYFPLGWRPTYIFCASGFMGAAMITFDWTTSPIPSASSIEGVTLYCNAVAGVGGVKITQAVTDLLFRDMEIMELGQNAVGFHTVGTAGNLPQAITWEHCLVASNINSPATGSIGWYLEDYAYDHQLSGCVAHHCGSDGFLLVGSAARRQASIEFLACRSEWNGGRGWGLNSGDKITLRGCTTDRNAGHGFEVQAGAMDRPLVIADCYFNRDGSSGSKIGIRIVDTADVLISNTTVATGANDGGGGTTSPQYGLQVTGAGTVVLAQGSFAGTTDPVNVASGTLKYSGTTRMDDNGVKTFQAATS